MNFLDEAGLLMEGLVADNEQPGIPKLSSILTSGLCGFGVDGQRCSLQPKPDPLGGAIASA